ncbi:hypothetical protein BCR34DRAFT_317685 [Clohesyomyces aquaticus]|uniref:Uncharacterized protein n=1 Tax=Clohesyomyces aquaticus TaxID=1231657 RepID=A0A1Y1ZMW5_9PLEO|nr:hypothetical protein BCR34DRAFT_317685 [Clohesyomyces aquaticus]
MSRTSCVEEGGRGSPTSRILSLSKASPSEHLLNRIQTAATTTKMSSPTAASADHAQIAACLELWAQIETESAFRLNPVWIDVLPTKLAEDPKSGIALITATTNGAGTGLHMKSPAVRSALADLAILHEAHVSDVKLWFCIHPTPNLSFRTPTTNSTTTTTTTTSCREGGSGCRSKALCGEDELFWRLGVGRVIKVLFLGVWPGEV